jgi:PAS domain S-box-containing protein
MTLVQGLFTPQGLAGLGIGIALAIALAVCGLLYVRQFRERLKRRHAELAATARRNQLLVEASGEGVLELDPVGSVRYANPAAARLLGYEVHELIGVDYRVLINARDMQDGTARPRQVRFLTDIAREVGAILRRKDGQRRPIEYRVVPMSEQGSAIGTVLTFSDVTERVRLDTLVRDMQRTARVGGWEYDVASRRLSWTDTGFASQELPLRQGMTVDEVMQHFHPQDRERLLNTAKSVRESGRQEDLEVRVLIAQGRELWVRIIIKGERRDNVVVRLRGTFQDVSDRIQAERQVRSTRDFYELTLDAMPVLVAYVNARLVVTYANATTLQWVSKPRERVVGKHLKELVRAETYTEFMDDVDAALRGEARTLTTSNIFPGRVRDVQIHLVPQMAADGEALGYFCIMLDITELKRLEQRLVQAQKMEAIGQLTGGIAHDFNNLLGVVLGNLQLLERSVAESPSLARKVHTAMRAAVRGADLTRRLLAFSRKQIFAPSVIDLERQLNGLADLMQRTLGDAIDVRMQLAPDVWHTRVDPGQLENAILNLAINARDAMPQGGRLTVQTGNMRADAAFCAAHPPLEVGDYVYISVTDTGCGIPPDVLGRVFEPFFTTKESGKGSGLGLAMVHSLAEQSGGAATIESTMGRGTTVRILLPRSNEEQSAHEDTIVNKIAPRGHETILVVEDDADLRETVVTSLAQIGYRALPAANADAALRILAGTERVDLLFTDVMMPGGTLGPALAKRARELRPGLEVLYTTGYAENSVLGSGSGISPSEVIQKPYRNEDLALRIRGVLDREARVA